MLGYPSQAQLLRVNSFRAITIFHVWSSTITIQLFGIVPLQFKDTQSQTILYASRPLDPLAGDGICVLPSLPLADAHTGPTRAPTHSRLYFPSRLAAPNPRSPTAGGEDDGGRRRPGSAEATARIQEHARAGRGSWGRGTLGSSAPSRDGRRQREVRIFHPSLYLNACSWY